MPCFDDAARSLLVTLGVSEATLGRVDEYYDRLAACEVAELDVMPAEGLPPETRALNGLEWLRQGMLHRAQSLTKATGPLAIAGHPHGIALCCRGQLETTAQLGYLARKSAAYQSGAIAPKSMADALGNMLFAASHPDFGEGPKPVNVMTYFQKADKHLAPILGDNMPIPNMLEDQYAWLSDFCHPNFQSVGLSTTLDAQANKVTFHHGASLGTKGAQLFHNLAISASCFVVLWDDLEKTVRQLRG